MLRNIVLIVALQISILAPSAIADVAAIHSDRLPQETSVLAALDDAKSLEPYSHSWSVNWKFPVAKAEVATRLGKDMGFLNFALKNHPDNSELLLLTGLVARYAYNLDVPGSYDTAINVLGEALKLAPSDFRGPWFRATLLCQTIAPKAGAEEFLSIENSHIWNQLPSAFWNDYMECASVTSMPAHELRAADHLEKLHSSNNEMRDFLASVALKRFDAYDPNKKYEPKDVWQSDGAEGDPYFTSTTCGLRLRAHGNWSINQLGLGNGGCIAYFSTGPYKATTRKLAPSVLVLVRQPEENETLQDFAEKFTKKGKFEAYALSRCPATDCIAMKGIQPGMYAKDGDGHGRIAVFEREQPQFPGLTFETPLDVPKSDAKEGAHYYRPRQIQQRIPGKLYYLVMLDTAASIEDQAMADFDFFLQSLTVE